MRLASASAEAGARINLDEHRLTDQDLEIMRDMSKVHAAPEEPSPMVRAILENIASGERSRRATMDRTWCRRLCAHRDEMRGTAFGDSLAEGSEWFIFLFATKSPLEAWFVRASVFRTSLTQAVWRSAKHGHATA